MTDEERGKLRRVNLRVKGKILKARFEEGDQKIETLHSALVDYGMLLVDLRYGSWI